MELRIEHTDLVVIGDKGYISSQLAVRLEDYNWLPLRTIPCRNQQPQRPTKVAKLLKARRHIIETVHGQRTEQLGIETNHGPSVWGVCARLYTTRRPTRSRSDPSL